MAVRPGRTEAVLAHWPPRLEQRRWRAKKVEWALVAPSRKGRKVVIVDCCCRWKTLLEGGFLGSFWLKGEEEQMPIGGNRGALPLIKREAMEGEGTLYGKPKGHAGHHGGCHGRPCLQRRLMGRAWLGFLLIWF